MNHDILDNLTVIYDKLLLLFYVSAIISVIYKVADGFGGMNAVTSSFNETEPLRNFRILHCITFRIERELLRNVIDNLDSETRFV